MKKFLLMCFSFGFALSVWAQDRVVTGKVASTEDGSALPGVNVVYKGTTNGTVTDSEGKYSISVPSSGGTLVFTFIGLKTQEVEIGERTVVDVQLSQDITQLSEVVVTALGIERSEQSLGYAVGRVKNSELTQAKAVNVAAALTGKVAGLQIQNIDNGVNPQTRITLRGNRSFTGNNQALIVIDGTQVSSEAINYLNPGDIESVNVLKGANAAALYGADASNGALIITTKKGSSNTTAVNFSNTTYWETVSFMPKFQERFGSGTENYSRVYIPFENQSFGPEFDGSMVDIGRTLEDGTIQQVPYSYRKDEKYKVWDTGVTSQNNISISGGDKTSSFFVSLQDINTKSVVPGDKNRRTTVRMNASKTFNKFKAGFNVSYAVRQTDKTTSDFYNNVLNTPGHIPLNSYRNWRDYKNPDGSLNYANPNNYFNDYFFSPWASKDQNRQNDRVGYLIANLELGYQFTDWFSALYRVGLTREDYDILQTGEKFTYNAFAKASGKYVANQDRPGFANDLLGYKNKMNQDFILSFKKKFGDFDANLIIGNNIREERNKGIGVTANALNLPGLYNISNRVGETVGTQGLSVQRVIGTYADITIGYKNFAYVHASGRQDDYSTLSPSNRSFFYPGVDVSFVLTEAIPSLKDNKILSYAKITGAASKVGNVNVDPYALQTVFPTGAGFPYGSLPGYSVGNTYADPNLKPEFTTSYEVGGEFGLLDSRVSLEMAYYVQQTTNQTVSIDIAQSTGYSRATVNAGTMDNNGFEIGIKATPVVLSNGFKWEVNVNYAKTSTTVASLYGGAANINLSNLYNLTNDGSLGQIFAEKGQQYPYIKAIAYLRDPQGRVVVDPSTGYPLKDTKLKSFGSAQPTDKLGITNTFKYRGFTLSALLDYRGGYYIYHGLASTMWFTGVAEATAAFGREAFVFPNSSYQAADGSYVANTDIVTKDGGLGAWDSNLRTVGENFVTNGAFMKLRELSLIYDLPKSIMSRTKFIKAASVGLVGRNLYTWLPKENKYTDPEFAITTSNAIGLNNTTNTPPTRTYGFTVNLTF